MDFTRRTFLKIAGLSGLAVGLKPAVQALAGNGGPGSGKGSAGNARRWALAIDARRCPPSCRECTAACHRVHNVPDFGNPKDEIQWIWKERFGSVFPGQDHPYIGAEFKERRFVVMCNHCEDPACVRVCPTKATFKRPDGIVMMDYHRCIGCRYCMAACPYGARSFNWKDPRPFIKSVNQDFPTRAKGVVEKCNFCEERLAKGLMPACVDACKEKAMAFGDITVPGSQVKALLNGRYSILRRPNLGTGPRVYYLL